MPLHSVVIMLRTNVVVVVSLAVAPQVRGPVVPLVMNEGKPRQGIHLVVPIPTRTNIAVLRVITVPPPVAAVVAPLAHRTMVSRAAVPPAVRPYHRVTFHRGRNVRFQIPRAAAPQQ